MKKISGKHSNRRLYNWLAYDIGDRFLKKHSDKYKGQLYDLGCGEAPHKEFFLSYAEGYIGVDWTGSYHNTHADISADLNLELPIDSEVADTVISMSVMEHLREPQTMLNEANRILKPGGNLVMQVPWQWWLHEVPYDFFRYTPYGLKYMLEKAGFTDVAVEPQSGFFSMWFLKFNYFSLRVIRGPRLLKRLFMIACIPFWYIGQMIAPHLDKLDSDWNAETIGYFVTAKKPLAK
jgi:SAM-dependent methyltransferase